MTTPSFAARVLEVEAIEQHPHAENLTVVTLRDHPDRIITNKEDGKFRYEPGDLCVHIPPEAVLKRWLMERLHAWDHGKGKGTLGGNRGDRMKPRKFPALDGGEEKFVSNGMLMPVTYATRANEPLWWIEGGPGNHERDVQHGDDITEFLEIVQYGS